MNLFEPLKLGALALANPDLLERWKNGVALSDFDPGKLYTPRAQGYSDYPRASN